MGREPGEPDDMRWLVQILGAALVVAALADIFLTVLYARSGIGVISHRLSRWNWQLFRRVAAPFPPKTRDAILTFGGPHHLYLYYLMIPKT